jgi:DNA-binding transcriptional ArsR family regulator
MPGFEPDLSGWRDGECPPCRISHAAIEAEGMTDDEKRARVLEEIRSDPTAPVWVLAKRTGVQRPIAVSVRKQAVEEGIADAATRRVRTPKTQPRVPASREDDLTAVRQGSGVTIERFAQIRGVPYRTAARRLRRLARDGLVECRRNGRTASYEAVSPSDAAA